MTHEINDDRSYHLTTKDKRQAALDALERLISDAADGIGSDDYELMNKAGYDKEMVKHKNDAAIVRAALTEPAAVYHDTDYTSPLRPKRLEYTMCGKIYAVQDNGERHMFMDVRGWGYLTGGGAKNLPREEAEAIQDKWANEVVNLWNNAAQPTGAEGVAGKCTGIPILYGFAEPVEGYAERPQDLISVLHEMGREVVKLREELSQLGKYDWKPNEL